jgi:hypothetical protein
MRALPNHSDAERRTNLDPVTGERLQGLLIAGPNAELLGQAFARILTQTRIVSAARQDQALLAISSGHFGSALVDCREDEVFQSIAIIAAKQFPNAKIVLLTRDGFLPRVSHSFANLKLLTSRNSTTDILEALDYAPVAAKPVDEAEPVEREIADQTVPSEPDERTDIVERTGEAASWIANILPRLTPLYSLIYKNLALAILGALFTAFVAFGIMIVFFLTSNKWSAPMTLSQGHELVVKIERELSDLNVRRNQINEQIDDAAKSVSSAQAELDRAKQLAGMIEGTISAEIETRSSLKAELEEYNNALRKLSKQFGSGNVNPDFKGNLSKDFAKRLINRNTFEAGKLAQLEAAHRTALIKNEIAANSVEIKRLSGTLSALEALSGHVASDDATPVSDGGADLVPLLNQVIDVRKGVSVAQSESETAMKRQTLLADSLAVVGRSIAQIESTPLARAAKANVTVLFVPYENADQYAEGNTLYSCAIGIFFCSEAGTAGKPIPGEAVATHPFFNKPVRGSFIEARLTDQEAARKEILHVKRRPLFF